MRTQDSVTAAKWYDRVVLGVIAIALATLAWQSLLGTETVVHAQFECGSESNPCYVRLDPTDDLIEKDFGNRVRGLKVVQR